MTENSPETTPENRCNTTQRPAETFTRRAFIFFIVGFLLLVAGHVFLYFAGQSGGNFFGRLAPGVIVMGYIVFGAGFLPCCSKIDKSP